MSPLPPLGFKSFAPAYVLEGNYYSIATVTVPSGGASTVTFAGVPQGYKHLQIRAIGKMTSTGGSGDEPWPFRFNGDSSASYTSHMIYGIGSGSAYGYANANNTTTTFYGLPYSGSNIGWGALIMDVLDYSSNTKTKTVRALSGFDSNGSGDILLGSSLYNKTDAITSISCTSAYGVFAEYSQFALYGVK